MDDMAAPSFIDSDKSLQLMHIKTTQNPDVLLQIMTPPFTSSEAISVQVVVIFFVIIVAVIGNSIMCYTVYRTPTLRTVTNIFTINLGATDMSVALLSLPSWIASLLLGSGNSETKDPFPVYWCQTISFVTVLLLLVSISTLAGVSLDRYLSICHPYRYPVQVTPRRVYIALFTIWLESFVIASCPLFGWGSYSFKPQSVAICNPAWSVSSGYAGFVVVVGIALPLAIMLFSYIRIIQEATKHNKQIDQVQLQSVTPSGYSNNEDNEKSEKIGDSNTDSTENGGIFQILKRRSPPFVGRDFHRSTSLVSKNIKTLKTVFIVIGAFFVCWGPYVMLNFWSVNNPGRRVPYVADFVTTLLAFSNSAVNPFVFMFLNREFRLALRLVYRRMTLCSHEGGNKPCLCEVKKRRASNIDSLQISKDTSIGSLQRESSFKNYFNKTPYPKQRILIAYDNPNFVMDEDPEILSPVGVSPAALVSLSPCDVTHLGIPGGVVLIPAQVPTDASNRQEIIEDIQIPRIGH